MSGPSEAPHLLRMARKDLQAMRALGDPGVADVETFGFHAQQAVEKALKAWLDLRGQLYPRIHDLDELFRMLREHGAAIPHEFNSLAPLTDFGVAFRYEAYDELEEPFERPEITGGVERLLQHVESFLPPEEGALRSKAPA
jgi:HEPN domain-containing protein